MKLVVSKSNLLRGVNIVSKAVPTRTTMAILECILIDASTNEIKLMANDLELGIETKIEGEIVERGIIALDAKFFAEVVRKLPDSEVTIETDAEIGIAQSACVLWTILIVCPCRESSKTMISPSEALARTDLRVPAESSSKVDVTVNVAADKVAAPKVANTVPNIYFIIQSRIYLIIIVDPLYTAPSIFP